MKGLTATQKKIIEVISNNPQLTSLEISEKAGIPIKTVTNNLTLLVNEKMLDRKMIEKKFRYFIIEEKKPAQKSEKSIPDAVKKPGVINSILEFIDEEGPITIDEIVKRLHHRFPEKAVKPLTSTVKVQIGSSKRPTRMEREKKIEFKIEGEGNDRTFSV